MISLPTNQTNTGQLMQYNVASTVWSLYIGSKQLILGRLNPNHNKTDITSPASPW